MKKLISALAILLLLATTLSTVSCGENQGSNPSDQSSQGGANNENQGSNENQSGDQAGGAASNAISITSATVDESGNLKLVFSNGVETNGAALPTNVEGISFSEAIISNGQLYIYLSDDYYMATQLLPTFDVDVSEVSLRMDKKNLLLTANGKDYDLGRVYYPTVPAGELVPDGACVYADRDISSRNTAKVEMKIKGYGIITILLDATTAPITVNNFISLAKSGFYDGLTFHRVIAGFVIQGGDPDGNGTGGSDTEIYGEFKSNGWDNDLEHKRGVLSMARTNEPNSATSQFFICNADAPSLNGNYAAFGYVLEGMNIVDEITSLTSPYGDYNGTIADTAKQAKIEWVRVISDLSQ